MLEEIKDEVVQVYVAGYCYYSRDVEEYLIKNNISFTLNSDGDFNSFWMPKVLFEKDIIYICGTPYYPSQVKLKCNQPNTNYKNKP